MKWFWFSFIDKGLTPGTRFVGGCYISEGSASLAMAKALALGLQNISLVVGNIEIFNHEIPSHLATSMPGEEYRNRWLDRHLCARAGTVRFVDGRPLNPQVH